MPQDVTNMYSRWMHEKAELWPSGRPPETMLKITYLYYDDAEIRTETLDLPAGF